MVRNFSFIHIDSLTDFLKQISIMTVNQNNAFY